LAGRNARICRRYGRLSIRHLTRSGFYLTLWSRDENPRRDVMEGCYLLHFARPVSNRHTTRHYIGWAADIRKRFGAHLRGKGGRLPAVAISRGIEIVVARIWEGADRSFEKKLKNRKEGPRLCPICSGLTRSGLDLTML